MMSLKLVGSCILCNQVSNKFLIRAFVLSAQLLHYSQLLGCMIENYLATFSQKRFRPLDDLCYMNSIRAYLIFIQAVSMPGLFIYCYIVQFSFFFLFFALHFFFYFLLFNSFIFYFFAQLFVQCFFFRGAFSWLIFSFFLLRKKSDL